MKSLLRVLIALLVLMMAMPSFAQFRQIRTIQLGNIGIDDTFGISVNNEAGHIYVIHLRRSIIGVYTFDWEQVERIQMPGDDLYGIDYNPEDNSIWAADYGGRHIYHLDLEGNSIDDWAYQQGPLAICKHPENDNLFVGDVNRVMHEITIDNEEVNSVQMDDIPTSVVYYPPNNTLLIMTSNDRVREYTLDLELVDVVMNDDGHGGNGLGMAYNPWTSILYSTWQMAGVIEWEDNYGAMPELALEPEEFDMQVPLGLEGEETLTISNVGEEDSNLRFVIDDIGEGVDWLTCGPGDGIVPEGEELEVGLLVVTEELEPGNFERTIILNTNSPDAFEVEIPVALTVIAGYGELRGTVTDPATEDPIAGVLIFVERFGFEAVTNEDGIYVFDEIPEWIYNIQISAEDYLPQRAVEVQVIEDEVTVLDFELLHSICDLSIENINEELAVNEEVEVDFTMNNPGNGPLAWASNLVFPEGMDADPWTLRVDVPAGVITEDSRIQGAVFVNDHFYLSAANNRDPLIYVLNRDQEVVDQYGQLGEGRYGYKDITFDGELIWGSGERVVYGFTPDGEEVRSFDSGISPCNNLAWDSDREILWASGTTTDITGFDRDGNQVAEISRHDLRVYGLAYWPDDPDGYQLYVFHKINEVGDMMIAKIDIENDDVLDVVSLEHEAGGVAQGCYITNQYDYYSWVFMGVANNGAEDRVDIWHLEANTGWVSVDPMEGILESGDEVDLTVSLSTLDFPLDLEFTVDLVFSHDGVGGESIIPIALTATGEGGGGPEERTVAMNFGWNMISTNVEPENNDVRVLTQALVDEDLMEMMKNGAGQFYSPAFGFNNIPGWEVDEGYMIKTTAECELIIEGMPVAADAPIPLVNGWQMIAYFPRVQVDAVVALSGIVDNLQMAKDGAGRFYSPAFGFSNMGDMREGQGYMVKIDGEVELVYVVEEDRVMSSINRRSDLEFLPVISPTSENMSLLILCEPVQEGEIGIYANDRLVGTGCITDGACGIAVWGDDPVTDNLEGAKPTEPLEIRLYNELGTFVKSDFQTIEGHDVYLRDEFWAVQLGAIETPKEFGIVSASPNPFNSSLQLQYNLTQSGNISIGLYDSEGRLVSTVINEEKRAGFYSVNIDGAQSPSGIYFVKLAAADRVAMKKVVLVK